jgi:hypothetical protein
MEQGEKHLKKIEKKKAKELVNTFRKCSLTCNEGNEN